MSYIAPHERDFKPIVDPLLAPPAEPLREPVLEVERSPRHAEALRLAAEGIPVFPCVAGGKDPVTVHGFQDRSADPDVINAWWSRADYNLGIVPHDMGLAVVDLDLYKRDGVSKALLDMLPATRTHRTPSGGEHRLYLSVEGYSNRGLGVNADVRSAAGYILWPPSVVNGAAYEMSDPREHALLPEAIRAHLGRARDKADVCQVPDDGIDHMLPEAREWCARYADNQSGDRFVAAAALVRNFGLTNATATELCHEFGIRTQSDSLEGTSWEKTLDNARKHGHGELGEGVAWQPPPIEARADAFDDTLQLRLARDPSSIPVDEVVGYVPGGDTVFDEFLEIPFPRSVPILAGSSAGQAILAKLIADLGGVANAPSAKRNRFGGRSPTADATKPPLTYWDRKEILPKGPVVGFVYGSQGSHKTGLFIKLALDAIEQKGAKVLFVAAEGAYGIQTARLPAAWRARGMSDEMIDAHWRTEAQTFNLLSPEDHEALFEAYEWFKPDLIFIDVLTKVAGGDINQPGDAGAIMNAASLLAQRFQSGVTFAHHPGKDTSRGMLGSVLLEALADFVLKVTHRDGKVWVDVQKLKDGPADRTVSYGVDTTRGVPVVVDSTIAEGGDFRPEDPVVTAIKRFLDTSSPTAIYDKGGLVQILRDNGKLPYGIAKGEDYVASLVDEGWLTGYAKAEGQGRRKRYIFQRGL
jgi:hypothetical protein